MRKQTKRTLIDDIIAMMHDNIVFLPKGCEDSAVSDETILEILKSVPNYDEPEGDRRGSRGTLLMFAACYHRLSIVKYLLANGASINLADKNGRTALHFAVQANNPDIVRTLLDNGAHPNAQDNYGNSPIMQANRATSIEIYDLLLKNGADPYLKNIAGICEMDVLASDPDRSAYVKNQLSSH